jgi:hypothetical protein
MVHSETIAPKSGRSSTKRLAVSTTSRRSVWNGMERSLSRIQRTKPES